MARPYGKSRSIPRGLFVGVDLHRVPKPEMDSLVALDVDLAFTIKTFEMSDPNLTDQIIAYLKSRPEGIADVGPSALGPMHCPTVRTFLTSAGH